MAVRPIISQAQAVRGMQNLLSAQAAEAIGRARLSASFPDLSSRLAVAVKLTRVHGRNADTACRHILCAEALVEVLEARVADGRGRKGDGRGVIIDEYSALVPAKLQAFPKRPAAERRRIMAAYPEVDVPLVRRALVRGDLDPEFAAGVLEDLVNYRAFLRTLPPRRLP